MKRTQLQLDEPTYQILRTKAFEEGVSMAAMIRDILHQHFGLSPRPAPRFEDFTFIGSGSSAPSHLDPISERHDEALAEDFLK